MGPDGMGLLALVHRRRQGARLETLENALRKKEPFELTYRSSPNGMRKIGLGARRASMPEVGGTGPPSLVEGFINDVTEKQKQDNTIRQGKQGAARAPQSPMFRRHRGQFAADHRRLRSHRQSGGRGRLTWSFTANRGTGKELAARAIHDAAPGISSPLWAVNCGAIPEASLKASCSATRRARYHRCDGRQERVSGSEPTGARFSSTNWVKSALWGR